MPCFHPMRAYRSREKNPETGRYLITFNPHKNLVEGSSFELPCGNCIGCRVDRSKDWAARCMHEVQMHPNNCFITLTFADEHLPPDYSVNVRTWQLFMKRLRKHFTGRKIRAFACGEYGDENLRPHYHALLFNHDFNDQVLFKQERDNPIFTSDTLTKIWGFGHCTVGRATYQTAAYVARYVLKKIGGEQADDHYTRPHFVTGKLCRVEPEFITSSTRPGIGGTWFDKFKSDAFPSDFIIVDGKKHKPPRFYLKKLKEEEQRKIKTRRVAASRKHKSDNTPERRRAREIVKTAALNSLKRKL